MAELNIDAELVKDQAGEHAIQLAQEQLVELSNGCICCTLRDDLLKVPTVTKSSDAHSIDFCCFHGTELASIYCCAAIDVQFTLPFMHQKFSLQGLHSFVLLILKICLISVYEWCVNCNAHCSVNCSCKPQHFVCL